MSVLLLAEDDGALRTTLTYNLGKEGFEVLPVANGNEAAKILLAVRPVLGLAIIDWMLPGASGLDLCRRLRGLPHREHLPVLMLTARGDVEDRVRGLEAGANDYLAKPFAMCELVARVRALVRRPVVRVFNRRMRMVRGVRGDVVLTPIEAELLGCMAERPGWVFSREQLLEAVCLGHLDPRRVDVHISRLRRALRGALPYDPIRTVHGDGYALTESLW